MSPQIKEMELLNEFDPLDPQEDEEDEIEINVIDYFHTFGAFIDRKKNEEFKLKKAQVNNIGSDNYEHYIMSPSDSLDMPKKLTKNI